MSTRRTCPLSSAHVNMLGRYSLTQSSGRGPSQSPSHSQAFSGGRDPPPSFVVPGHARPQPTCTGSSRIGKRVGETLKSSNLLSSASALIRKDRKRATAVVWLVGSPVSIVGARDQVLADVVGRGSSRGVLADRWRRRHVLYPALKSGADFPPLAGLAYAAFVALFLERADFRSDLCQPPRTTGSHPFFPVRRFSYRVA